MSRKKWILLAAGVVVLAGAGGAIWWALQPHSAQQMYQHARAAEDKLQARATDLAADALAAERERIIKEYERVFTEFADDGWHAEARNRIAQICEELLKDKARAATMYEELLAKHPESKLAEEATHRLARLYKDLGLAEKDQVKSVEWFRKALTLLQKFIEKNPTSARVEDDTMEIARLWQDHIQEPPIEAKDALERYLAKYEKGGKYVDEALFRLGRWMESVHEYEAAARLYSRVADEFPKSAYRDQATERAYEIFDKKLKDNEKAAEAARKIAQRNPGTQKGARFATRAGEHEAEQLKEKSRKYESDYYGAPTVDVTADKPWPYELYGDIIAQKLDTISYKLDVAIDPKSGELKVKGEAELVNGGEEKKELLVQFNGGMTLENVKLDGAGLDVAGPSMPGREVVLLKLSKPWAAGARGALTFEASGKFEPPVAVPEGVNVESGEVPSPETVEKIREGLKGDIRVRLGETGYAISAAAWYPLTIYGDVFTTDVTYRLPESGYELAATGEISVPQGPGTIRRYVSRTPIFGLYFAYGKYAAVERDWTEGRKIVAYVPAERKAMAEDVAARTAEILTFLEGKFGRLKQPRMTVTIVRLPAFLGGMGPAGMVMLAEHFVRDKPPSDSLLAHELAHQWWGNAVPISFEKGYAMWLSEGFATYSDALWNEHKQGRPFLVRHLQKYGLFYFEGVLKMPALLEPVGDCFPDNALYRQTVYEKGALVLHTLRYVMGDEKFFEALRRYAAEYEGKHSTLEDFRRVAESASGQDLRWFFDDCLRRKDLPHYTIADLEVGSDPDGPYTVVVRQTVPGTEAPWRLPLDIVLRGAEGQEHVVRKATVDQEVNRVVVRLPWKPQSAELDPEYWVFKHPGGDNQWPHPPEAPASPAGTPGDGSAGTGPASGV